MPQSMSFLGTKKDLWRLAGGYLLVLPSGKPAQLERPEAKTRVGIGRQLQTSCTGIQKGSPLGRTPEDTKELRGSQEGFARPL